VKGQDGQRQACQHGVMLVIRTSRSVAKQH
jgi:hypothetical protein